MKKILIASLFLSANIKMAFAKTGTISGDDIVIWGPVVLIAIILVSYKVKAKLKARKEKEAETMIVTNTGENSSPAESSEE